MRKLYLCRGFHVMGVAAGIKALLDNHAVATLTVNEEEVCPMSADSHELQFVPSGGSGPRSEIIRIPAGESDYRVKVNIKLGLLGNKLETEITELGISESDSDEEQGQKQKKQPESGKGGGIFGSFAAKIGDKIEESKEARYHWEEARIKLLEKFEESTLMMVLIEYIKMNSSDELAWAVSRQSLEDRGYRMLEIEPDSWLVYWKEYETVRTYEGKETRVNVKASDGLVFSKAGYAPLDKMTFEEEFFDKMQVTEVFTEAFIKEFKKAFPELSFSKPSYSTSVGPSRKQKGYEIEYKVPEMKLQSII